MEIATITIAVGYLSKLLKVGLAFYEAWQNEGFDTKELSALGEVLDVAGGLGGKQREQELAALHLAIITRCFGQAVGRYWANNRKPAPTQPGQKTWRLHLFMSKEEKQRTKELEARMESAAKNLLVPGAQPAGHKEWSLVESLVGSPLATPYYQALWKVFSEPRPDTSEAGESPPAGPREGRADGVRASLPPRLLRGPGLRHG
jgi:hypothetical protein